VLKQVRFAVAEPVVVVVGVPVDKREHLGI